MFKGLVRLIPGRTGRRAAVAALFTAAMLAAAPVVEPAAAQALSASTAQQIADHFSSIRTMTGEFVQIGPSGQQTGGKFFIERPGKLRFNYDPPSPLRVISDGRSVVVGNSQLGTWDLYPLSSTPLKLLLSRHIDLSGSMVKSVKQGPDLTTIVLGDHSLFGNSTITMMFDPSTYDLKQWTITDPQGKDTTVMIYNVQTGVQLADNIFRIPQSAHESISPRQ